MLGPIEPELDRRSIFSENWEIGNQHVSCCMFALLVVIMIMICFGIVVGSCLFNCEIVLGSFWDNVRTVLQSCRDNFGIVWDHLGIVLGSFGDCVGIVLGSCLNHVGIMLRSFGDRVWDTSWIVLG